MGIEAQFNILKFKLCYVVHYRVICFGWNGMILQRINGGSDEQRVKFITALLHV